MPRLSIAEQKLVEFAREAFGEFVTQFLLAGLGEKDVGRRWRFDIAFDDGKTKLRRRVEVITHEPEDGSSCLPRGRDPLVLLALLRILTLCGEGSNPRLLYDQEDVLKLLGRADTPKARREMDQAVRRYFMMTFKWGMSRAEQAREGLWHYTAMESIFSETEAIDREGEDGRMKRAVNRVDFNPNFIEHLKGRSLFDVDWGRVTSVSYAHTS
jgi:hypothetical protein